MTEESSLEELKGKLYSKKSTDDASKKDIRFKPYSDKEEIIKEWKAAGGEKETVAGILKTTPKESSPLFKKAVLLTISFSLLAITSVAFFMWLKGGSSILYRNLEIKVGGPVSAVAGEVVPFYIEIKNRGNINIESADLILEYPEGFRLKNNPNIELTRDRKTLGKIGAGESINQIIELVIFGEGGSSKTLKVSVEYRLEGSSAILMSDSSFTINLSQSPVDIVFNFPTEVKTRQAIDFEIEVKSNSETLLKDLHLQIGYPPGFKLTGSKPEPAKNNIWKLGDLIHGKSKKIVLTGTIEGQDMEEKVFHATVGMLAQDKIANTYNYAKQSIVLRKPSFNVAIVINGKDLEKTPVFAGERVYGELIWENSLPVEIRDSTIRLKISGVAVDQATVFADNGFYRSGEEVLIWSRSTEPDLASIAPGQKNSVRFSFLIKKPLPVRTASDKNFIVDLDLSMVGKKTEEGGANVEVRAEIQKKILVHSELQFAVRGLHYSGPFVNSGPMPPKVGSETTYTVIWSIVNYSNDIDNTRISAALPPYMRWVGNTAPAGASIAYDEGSGLITWNKGVVRAGAGILTPAEEAAFQIALLPAPNQVSSSPEILFVSKVTGIDSFTGREISIEKLSLDTTIDDDPQFKYGDGTVVK